MDLSLNLLECFVRSAEMQSFSSAARRLGLSPAAVSKNVARLERQLDVRLFQRTTRRLTLTEAGLRLHEELSESLTRVSLALGNAGKNEEGASGTLKVSVGVAFGREYVLPHLSAFLARYPRIIPDWHFENRHADLVAEGFDAAVGAGYRLPLGVVAKKIARIHQVFVASPSYLAGIKPVQAPADLAGIGALRRREGKSGRLRPWTLQTAAGEQVVVDAPPRAILSDPEALCHAALHGVGVAMVPLPHALRYLERGDLVRVLPRWYADAGDLSIYYAGGRTQLPAKTRAFVEFMTACFEREGLAKRFSAT